MSATPNTEEVSGSVLPGETGKLGMLGQRDGFGFALLALQLWSGLWMGFAHHKELKPKPMAWVVPPAGARGAARNSLFD